jgi:hypothetical protein
VARDRFTPDNSLAAEGRSAQQYALKREPLARETASKTDVTILSRQTHKRFVSSLVFDTVATALCQLGSLLCV